MTPFEPATLPALTVDQLMAQFGITREQAEQTAARFARAKVFLNDLYQVNIDHVDFPPETDWPPMLHLSIKRIDKEPIHDWRHLQQIKNELVGPEHEGVELYPADSRLVDAANQYHLWVFAHSAVRLPFGFADRLTATPEEAAKVNARQRP